MTSRGREASTESGARGDASGGGAGASIPREDGALDPAGAAPAPGGEPVRASEDPTDGELVRRTLAGDRAAFGVLVTRYDRVIAVLAFQKVGNVPDAEDVAQEAFLKAYAALQELHEVERFGSWLYGIAFRAAIDTLRRRGRRGPVMALDGQDEPVDQRSSEGGGEDAERRETAERVQAAVGALPDKYRLILTLRYQKHMSYQEIAAHLGEPAGTVANRIHRAAKMVRERLTRLGVTET